MKLYAYNLPRFVCESLQEVYPNLHPITNTQHLSQRIQQEDALICMWDDKDTLKEIKNIDNTIFPQQNIIHFSSNREEMSRFVDQHSSFPLEREYVKFSGFFPVTVPKLENSLQVVAKVGESHRGQNKFLLYPGQTLTVQDSVIFEEFVEDAESFRVLLIGENAFVIEYHDNPDAPRNEEQSWIKNLNPLLEENENQIGYEKEIEDARHLAKILGYSYIGVDYVKNDTKTVCVEINPFPGVRLNERTKSSALKYWEEIIKKMSK